MYGALIEYCSLPQDNFLSLTREAEDQERLLKGEPEHEHDAWYSQTFGDCDLLVVRWFSTYFPFYFFPHVPNATSRRVTGVLRPSPEQLQDWAYGDRPGPRPVSDFCRPDPSRATPPAYLTAIYVDLSLSAMVQMTPDDFSGACGPIRQLIGQIACKEGAFEQRLRHELSLRAAQGRPDSAALTITPLMGLDRVPVVLLVESDLLDDVGAVLVALRALSQQDVSGALPRRRPALLPEGIAADEAVVADTITVTGARFYRPETVQLDGSPPPLRFAGALDAAGLLAGGFETDLRFPAGSKPAALPSVVQMVPDHPVSDVMFIGHRDQRMRVPADAGLRRFTNQEILTIIRTLRGVAVSGASVRELYTMTVPVLALPEGSGVPPLSRAAARRLEDALWALRALRSSRDAHADPQSWAVHWRQRLEGPCGLSYALAIAGYRLIDDTLRMLPGDVHTYTELLPSVLRILLWTDADRKQPVVPWEAITPNTISHQYHFAERLLDTRSRRGSPVRRTPRPVRVNDHLAAYDLSRLAFSALANAIAAVLGLADIILLDTVAGHMRVISRIDGGTVIETPSTHHLVPMLWGVLGHELAHASFAFRHMPSHPDPLWEALRDALWACDPTPPDRPVERVAEACLQLRGLSNKLDLNGPDSEDAAWAFHEFGQIAEEVLADLQVAALLGDAPGSPQDRLDRFYAAWGPSLMLAVRDAHGQTHSTSVGAYLLMRVALLSFVFRRCVGIEDRSWRQALTDAFLECLSGTGAPTDPIARLLCRFAADMELELELGAAAGRMLLGLNVLWSTDAGRIRSQMVAVIDAWVAFAEESWRSWRDGRASGAQTLEHCLGIAGADNEHMALMQAILPQRAWADAVIQEMRQYAQELLTIIPARPWMSTEPSEDGLDPYFSLKGGPRSGTGAAGSGTAGERFRRRYYRRSTAFLVRLAQLERIRRLAILERSVPAR